MAVSAIRSARLDRLDRLDQAWNARGEGEPLPAELRERLGRALGADLSAVRVHIGAAADAAARAYRADAVASGSAIFFRDGAYRPRERGGRWLIAHEVAHTVQQAAAGGGASAAAAAAPARAEADSERLADRFADAFAALPADGRFPFGALAELALARPADGLRTVGAGLSGAVQRHSSFEHRYFGDGTPDGVRAITARDPGRDALLNQHVALVELFDRKDPENVTEADLRARGVVPLRLGPDRVIVTLGEVNALPDYLANPEQIDTVGGEVLIPILQAIRQEGYNEFKRLLDPRFKDLKQFPRAPFKPAEGLLGELAETAALDRLTTGLGPAGQDHYQGLLARNACHFAPYSWYRWTASHLAARQRAEEAYRAAGDRKDELIRQTRNLSGYADHFLEDSFASGHLIDKTLIMQWFVEWSAGSDLVADEDALRYMTAALQPGLAAGSALYDPLGKGPSHDPQTVQELRSRTDRAAETRLRPGREDDRLSGYVHYLTFLAGAAAQLGSNLLHNDYNGNSLWAASIRQDKPYRLYGDSSLMLHVDGAEGAYNTAYTAELSRRAIQEIITTGHSDISPAMIREYFPTRVGDQQGKLLPIAEWASGSQQRAFVEEKIFRGALDELGKLAARFLSPRLGVVSRDQPLGEQFATRLDPDQDSLDFEQAVVLAAGGRQFAASNRHVFELNPESGVPLKDRTFTLPHDDSDSVTSIAADEATLYVGTVTRVYALPLTGLWSRVKWVSPKLGQETNTYLLTLLTWKKRLFAADHGYIYELFPETGGIRHRTEVHGFPGEYPVALAADDEMLYIGAHGYAYAVHLSASDWNKWAWTSAELGRNHEPVGLLADKGLLFAVSDGTAYVFDPRAGGRLLKQVRLTAGGGIDSNVPSLVTDGGRLYASTRGGAYAVPLDKDQWGAEPVWKNEGLIDLSLLDKLALVELRYQGDRLFAGADGFVYELDLTDGGIVQQWQLTWLLTRLLLPQTRVAGAETHIYPGVHGYAYGMVLAGILPRPAGVWPLSQTTGTNVPDQRGIHPAVARGGVSWRPISAFGACAVFDGTGGTISTTGPVLETGPGRGYTVEAWVRLDRLPAVADYTVLSQAGSAAPAFALGYSAARNRWVFNVAVRDNPGLPALEVFAQSAGSQGVWTHVAGVYDPVGGSTPALAAQLRIYIDGTLQGSLDVDPALGFDAKGSLWIGATGWTGAPGKWLRGAVRGVRVYDQALTELQLEPQATAFWLLDEDGFGKGAKDRNHRHDVSAVGVTSVREPGVGRCAELNGSNSGLTTRGPVLYTGPGGSFTVAAWVSLPASSLAPVVLLGQDGKSVSAFTLEAAQGAAPGTSEWSFVRYDADSDNPVPTRVRSGVPYPANTWVHVTGVYNAAAHTLTVYTNGVERGTGSFSDANAFASDGPFTIGYGRFRGVAGGRLRGKVRDVRAYSQALSGQQVRNLLVNS